jgi:intein/homing endonuclease
MSMISQLGCPFGSVTGDTFIFTSRGLERIDEFEERQGSGVHEQCVHGASYCRFDVNEPVATREGTSVAPILIDEGVFPVYEVRHKFGIPLRGTAGHPILAVDGDTLVWKRIDELKKGDWIACKFPDPVSSELQPLPIVPKLRAVPPGGFHSREIRIPAFMDEELAWLVGFMLGDGCIPMDGRPSIHVCVTADVKQRLVRVFREKFDLKLNISASSLTDNMEHGWVHSRVVYEFFVQTLGISPSNKLNVPDVIRRSPQSVIQAFLNGLWDADGYETKSANYLCTVNDEFARQIAMLLLMVRKIPLLRRIKGERYNLGRHFRVGILHGERIPVQRSLYLSKKSGRWFWRTKKSSNRTGVRRRTLHESGLHHPLDIDGIFYSQVQEIVSAGEERVYDLTVPVGENFVASGVIVHNCNFCGGRNSNMLRRIRTRSSENVIEEMRQLHERFGIEGIMMLDDELNVNRELVPLMREIAKMGIDWRMRGFVKAELFTDEQAEAMYAAGFRDLMCGFESAHPRILKNINKRATVEDNTRMIRTAHKHGLKVKALMSFGHPGDSEETLLATRDWLIEEKADDFNCSVITLYPGTPYYDDSVQLEGSTYVYETNGDRLYSENIDFTKEFAYYVGAYGDYKAYVWTDYLSRERICQLRDEVEHEVRAKLGIPYASGAAALNYEFSMGSTMPPHILRKGKE